MSVLLLALLLFTSWLVRLALGSLGRVAGILRVPGNLLHELAHAVVMLACGYTVLGFTISAMDPEGRGGVRPGAPWAPWARSWLANLISPVAPVAAGWAALALLREWGGLPGLPRAVAGVLPVATTIPWERWQAWASVLLSMSVAAELAPSDVDLRVWRWPALGLVVVGGFVWFVGEKFAPGVLVAGLAPVDAAMLPSLASALAMAVWAGVTMLPLATIARWSR